MSIFISIEHLFTSDKAKEVLKIVNTLVPIAFPIVGEIEALVPNKTVDQVMNAYQKFGIPLNNAISTNDPSQIGNALLNLGTSILQKNLPPDKVDASLSILNTAIQLAVIGNKK